MLLAQYISLALIEALKSLTVVLLCLLLALKPLVLPLALLLSSVHAVAEGSIAVPNASLSKLLVTPVGKFGISHQCVSLRQPQVVNSLASLLKV